MHNIKCIQRVQNFTKSMSIYRCEQLVLLGNKYTRSTHFFDLSFCSSTEKLCFHYNWLLREVTFTKYFVVTLWGGKKTEK